MQFNLLFLSTLVQFANIASSFRDCPAKTTNTCRSDVGNSNFEKACFGCTVYRKSIRNVLMRKKRGFTFYKGTVVVVTDVMALNLINASPNGMIQSNEIDLFYDVPLLVEGWREPVDYYINNIKAQMKIDKELNEEDEKLKSVGVVNASAIPLDEYNKIQIHPARPIWTGKLPVNYGNNKYKISKSGRRNFHVKNRRPYYRKPSRHYYPNGQRRNYVPFRSQNNTFSSYRPQQSTYIKPYRPLTSSQSARNHKSSKTASWHNHREYRERRDIYEQLDTFGKALGKQLRKCILRAICEMQEELLPEGESFINDVARIIFTVPTDHDNRDDEFVQMALEKNVDCARRFMLSCPHSPLDYFMNNFKPKTPRPTTPTTEKMS